VSPARAECAVEPLAIAAALDDPVAQYNLAVELYRGECVERDLAKAAALWRLAAEAGNVSAHNNLGFLLFRGEGVAQDEAEGLRLWRHAAERGHAESQAHLAWAYLEGRAVPRDRVLAWAWARTSLVSSARAPGLGGGPRVDAIARDLLERAEAELPPERRPEAERTARELIAKHAPAPPEPPPDAAVE